MSRIKGQNTKPEILVRRLLKVEGIAYRTNAKKLPGKPDIVLKDYKLAIFVHGCFWHFHSRCREGRVPSTRPEYWGAKLVKNKTRDAAKRRALKKLGWNVLTLWECQIEKKDSKIIQKIVNSLN